MTFIKDWEVKTSSRVKSVTRGKNSDGTYTEYAIHGKRDKIVVQSTTWRPTAAKSVKKMWGVYRVSPGGKGVVKTIGMYPSRIGAEQYALGYINGM